MSISNRLLDRYQEERSVAIKSLENRKKHNERQQRSAQKKRDTLKRLAESGNIEAKKVCHDGVGRPRMEDEDSLLEAVKEVVIISIKNLLNCHMFM